MTRPQPRSLAERVAAVKARLTGADQLWLATGSAAGPHLIPVAFVTEDVATEPTATEAVAPVLVTATLAASTTVRNITRNGRVRVAIGETRDVVMIDAAAEPVAIDELPTPAADKFATVSVDPRDLRGFTYLRLSPERIQVWNGMHEFPGRTVMLDGRWLTDPVD